MKRSRIYHNYSLWEDYHNGMYDLEKAYNEKDLEKLSKKVAHFLSNSEKFYAIGIEMVREWKKSSEVNLSNRNRNRQAWIGQASCSYHLSVPERITKVGWRLMSPTQQKEANKVADKIIFMWENHGQKVL